MKLPLPIEAGHAEPLSWARLKADFDRICIVNGLLAFIFAATGPVAIILSVGAAGGLSREQLASWLFGAFFGNGLLTLWMSRRYRMPLIFFWTIPGTIIVGPALIHLSWPEVVGAFIGSGVLMLLIGWSGLAKRAAHALPAPVVMGMVAGIFLKFGLQWLGAFKQAFWLAAPMSLVFFVISARPGIARRMPPLIAALAVGIACAALLDRLAPIEFANRWFAQPLPVMPRFTWQAMLELVVPLTVTVLIAQNMQGYAVLDRAGHRPPVTAVTIVCGLWSTVLAVLGTVNTCLTGPSNALAVAGGEPRRQYVAALTVGALAVVFGLAAPLFTELMLAAPVELIVVLAGLAMLRPLQSAFTAAFAGPYSLGALISLLVTLADQPIFSISAAFWALVFGTLIGTLVEPAQPAGVKEMEQRRS